MLRVLVVDDEPVSRLVALGQLARFGAWAVAVEGGEEALLRLRRERFDVVLLDLHLRGIDGIETARRIRLFADSEGHSISVVALTAGGFAGDRERRGGFDAHLTKPVRGEALEAVLRRVTESRPPCDPPPGGTSAGSSGDDPFDPEFALRQAGGDRELLVMVLRQFLTSAETWIPRLRERSDSGDFVGMADVAHCLRGSASNLGADRLVNLARRLEREAGSARAAGLADQVDQLERELGRLRTASEPFTGAVAA